MMTKLTAALAAATLALTGAMPAEAGYSRPGGVKDKTCYKEVYREEYVPGTKRSPGYVRRWTDKKRVPCNRPSRPRGHRGGRIDWLEPAPRRDDNSCIEGSILGGIAGGGIGAALSRDEGNLLGIPLGIVGGALIGCQIDGG